MATTSPPPLHDDLIVYEILTRVPAATAVRLRSVCRAWKAALTSDAFAAARRLQPEILFFPPDVGTSTSFYTYPLLPPADAAATATVARKLVTLGGLTGEYVVLSRTQCRGLTLVLEARKSEYYLCNLSTGDHVALPPFDTAAECRNGARFHPLRAPWTPFENSSTGVGFDATTGEHKVVRLFMDARTKEVKCEVYTPGSRGGWRPCAGHPPPQTPKYLGGLPPVAVDGSFYWLPSDGVVPFNSRRPILSLSIDDEQFGWVQKPPGQKKRVRHLADLDGSLCAVVVRGQRRRWAGADITLRVIELLTWTTSPSSSWSTRCRISLDTLPMEISDELDQERTIVPLCTASGSGGGKIVLLATGRHKVFAYDEEKQSMEKIFSMYDYVDFPVCHTESRLLINIVLHDDRLVSVRRPAAAAAGEDGGGKGLQVKMGGGMIQSREKHRHERQVARSSEFWRQTWTEKLRDRLPSNAL